VPERDDIDPDVTPDDERVAARVAVDATMFVEVGPTEASDQRDIVICQSIDLSRSGAKLVLDHTLPRGRELNLCLELKGSEPVFVVGRVVWQRDEQGGKYTGLVILDVPDSEVDAWRAAVEGLAAGGN